MINPFRRIGDSTEHDPTADAELTALVERVVKQELDALVARANVLHRPIEAAEVLELLQWLGPWVTQVVFDAIKLGMSLREGEAPAAAQALVLPQGGPAPVERSASQEAASAEPSAITPIRTPVAAAPAPTPERPEEVEAAAGAGASPWLLSGHVTLLVSPFEGFTEVQRFLRDLSRIPRIFDVKPKRFSGGRLYISLGTEYTDTQTLADILATELSPYRPVLRSVQNDFVEFLLRQTPAETASAS